MLPRLSTQTIPPSPPPLPEPPTLRVPEPVFAPLPEMLNPPLPPPPPTLCANTPEALSREVAINRPVFVTDTLWPLPPPLVLDPPTLKLPDPVLAPLPAM